MGLYDATCPTTITRTTSTLIEKEKVLIMAFIDLGKAYDNVCREKLCMENAGGVWGNRKAA